ncbi:MAG: hypothetical protein ABIF01_03775 [Candidatus Micrarchaeota archaeon]
MATMGKVHSKEANAVENPDWKDEVEQVTYMRNAPTLHMFKKPSWAKEKSAMDLIEPVSYESIKHSFNPWKSVATFPMLVLLALPILLAFALTSLHLGAFPDSMTAHAFRGTQSDPNGSAILTGFWAVALVAFVPWSASVCKLESWVSKHLD